jgi:hypothetical protein
LNLRPIRGLQETEHPIRQNDKDPILIKKILEFLYTGNYTAPYPTQTSKITQTDSEDVPEIDIQFAEEPSRESQPENNTTDKVNSLIDYHPFYFYIRIYSKADYFIINDLKSKAEAYFYASFMTSPERESFAQIIEELYSTRANYQKLRQLAIETIVANLPSLRNGPAPVVTSELIKSIPDFTYDLLQATLDKYMREPSNVDGVIFK